MLPLERTESAKHYDGDGGQALHPNEIGVALKNQESFALIAI
jgi:hypothetical protein